MGHESRLGGWWSLIAIWWLGVVAQLFLVHTYSQNLEGDMLLQDNIEAVSPASGVHLFRQNKHIVMNNGIVSVTLSVPDGQISSITYKGSENLLEPKNREDDRGYWNVIWNKPGAKTIKDKLVGTSYKVIVQNKDQTEISFTTTWAAGSAKVPLNVDKRFVMLRDSPGFYTYAVLERLKGWPAFVIQEGRTVFKLQENKFHYMAMSDERQRIMPMPVDRFTGQVLDYPEAVLLTRPINPHLKGEVDDKYMYSWDNKDNKVHGWVSNDPPLGFWMITPSNEFRTGGPLKQDLTSHVAATVLSMYISTHYAGEELALKFQTEEYWKIKPKGGCKGYKSKEAVPGTSAYVGLAPTGGAGSWQLENKGYQFWTQTDHNGNFLIRNVIPGTYSLFAWVPGTLGDYKHASDITITPGSTVEARNVIFEAPRRGPTLWEIGIPDRTAAEFFIPDPSPIFKIHAYSKPDEKFRQYGLWSRYKDYYPRTDLVYTVGRSDYKKDWFFAHVTRNVGDGQFQATTWQIVFDLKNVSSGANYTLQLALASANEAELQVRINNPKSPPHFTTGLIGRDNALARHGIHGLYHFYSIAIAGGQLVGGRNIIFLTQARSQGPFREVMYDYIRLELPA